MKITQVRNATQIIEYAGKKFLIDPMLAPKGTFPGFPGTVHSEISNPTVDLPLPLNQITNVDAVLLTHTHADHWDQAAAQAIPKNTLMLVQNENDLKLLRSQGFKNVRLFTHNFSYAGIEFSPTPCQHGWDKAYQNKLIAELLGEVSGVILKSPKDKKLYIVGDSIWTPKIEETMLQEEPDVVILNTGWAHLLGYGPIIMGKEDVLRTHQVLPNAKIVATHMDAVNHAMVTKNEMRNYARDNLLTGFVFVPEDGETIDLE